MRDSGLRPLRALRLVACAALAFGCVPRHPDLRALYSHRQGPRTPLILVHGILGARLRHAQTGREIWPGGSFHLFFHRYTDLALSINEETLAPAADDVVPYDLFDGRLGFDVYGRLVGSLTGPGAYRLASAPGLPRTLYFFCYDWRLDNAFNAARLDELIEGIRAEHGDPALRVDVVAHSMGGLLVRYFERFGSADVLEEEEPEPTFAGGRKIRKSILMGTPSLGSIGGLQAAVEGVGLGFGRIPPEVAATWPATYELLPNHEPDWMVDAEGRRVDRDPFDVDTWKEFRWTVFDPLVRKRILGRFQDRVSGERYLATLEGFVARSLVRARRFFRAISRPSPEDEAPDFILGGDCISTQARCLVEFVDGRPRVRMSPSRVSSRSSVVDYRRLMLEPGDGVVTKASALGPIPSLPGAPAGGTHARSFFLCETHAGLPGDLTLHDNLLNLLLDP